MTVERSVFVDIKEIKIEKAKNTPLWIFCEHLEVINL